MANDRISQLPVEAVILPDTQKARVSQLPVEALVLPDTQKARISQLAVEVIIANAGGGGATGRSQAILLVGA